MDGLLVELHLNGCCAGEAEGNLKAEIALRSRQSADLSSASDREYSIFALTLRSALVPRELT